jgi:hypothetical protein
MPETLDELSAPLGLNTAARKRWARLPFTAKQALALLLGLSLVAFGVAGFNKHFLGSEPVVIVNESLARTLWPGQNAIGQVMTQDGGRRVVDFGHSWFLEPHLPNESASVTVGPVIFLLSVTTRPAASGRRHRCW